LDENFPVSFISVEQQLKHDKRISGLLKVPNLNDDDGDGDGDITYVLIPSTGCESSPNYM
jgi:hypothetical protein